MELHLMILACLLMVPCTMATTKPHILMIMADDLGWNDVGFQGSIIETPNIDALARSGVVLKNYYTAPNCGPSRAQFLTGNYLTHLGLQHKNLQPCRPRGIPLRETTVADELKTLGYKSHLIGKWHGGYHRAEYMPTNRGFDTFRGMLNGMGDHFTHTKGFRGEQFLDFWNDTTPYTGANGIYSTDYFKGRALEVIDEHSKSGQPMFMFLSFQAPHTPNQAPQALIDKYAHIPDQGRRNYAAMVTGMDAAIGDVVAELVRKGMYENTVLVFSTDNGGQALNGGASNYPLRGNKGTYYEAGIRGIAVLSSPMTKFVGESESLVHITDWKPTFVHLAGGKLRNHDGVNQWQTLTTANSTSSRTEIIYNIDPLSAGRRRRGSRRGARRRGRRSVSPQPSTAPFASFRGSFGNATARPVQPTASIPRNTFVQPFFNESRFRFDEETTTTTSTTSTTTEEEILPFNTEQLAVIRSGDWKLLTGPIGYNQVVPNPDTHIFQYLFASKSKNFDSGIQLYNIKEDPTESRDLSSTHPDLVRNLIQRLARHQQTATTPFYPPSSYRCGPKLFGNVYAWGPYM